MFRIPLAALAAFAVLATAAGGAQAAALAYRQPIRHDPAQCAGGKGAAALITVTDVAESRGRLRVQSYRATSADWLQKGRWINRIEVPARAGTMRVCMPLPGPGAYAIAIRHDRNGNGDTDLRVDGGGMSNNPSINIFNLGKPSVAKTRFTVADAPRALTIAMRYM